MKKKYYITFGQAHIHKINNIIIDKDCVVLLYAKNMTGAEIKAEALFGDKYSAVYKNEPNMKYYPKGIIELYIPNPTAFN